MIEINLNPGARKPVRGARSSVNIGESFRGAIARITDPFLVIAIVGVLIGVGATALQYVVLNRNQTALADRQKKALDDSTKFAIVLAERAGAEANRDSAVRQFSFIKSVDGQRYTWAHVLAELSRALPAYTWLVRVSQTSPVISVVSRDTSMLRADSIAKAVAAGGQPDTSKAGRRPKRSRTLEEVANLAEATVPKLTLTVIAQTVDVQAMTSYLRLLDASPFLENVNFIGSDTKKDLVSGQDVVEFTFSVQFSAPPPSAIRTVPLTVSVR